MTTKITELKERIVDDWDEQWSNYNPVNDTGVGVPPWSGGDYEQMKDFISQALDQVIKETRKETLEDVMILIERYAKENFEEVIISDHKVIKCECGGHLIEWYLCKKFTGYACDKRF